MTVLAVVVPAGGRGRRLSQDKLSADVNGRALLDRTLDGLPEDAVIICVGPEIPTRRSVGWVRESPPYAGPLGAVEAGVDAVPKEVDVVVLVGGDMPWSGQAIPALLAALDSIDGRTAPDCAVLTDGSGRLQPLLSAWRLASIVSALTALDATAGRPLSALLDRVQFLVVEDLWSASEDVDTPADLASARDRFRPPPA